MYGTSVVECGSAKLSKSRVPTVCTELLSLSVVVRS